MRFKVIVTLSLLLAGGGVEALTAQTWRNDGVTRRRQREESLDVKIEYAVGRFKLVPISGGELLYRLNTRYDEEAFDLYSSYRERDNRGRLRIDLEGRGDFELNSLKDYDVEAGSLELHLTDGVPISLAMELGAVEAELELGGLRLTKVDVQIGASDTRIRFSEPNREVAERCSFKVGAAAFEIESLGNSGCRALEFAGGVGAMTLDFSGRWNYDATGEIKVGLGTVEIRIPAEIGVRLERETFLVSLEAPGFTKGDDVWVSRNWAEASHRLELNLSGALGTIRVVRI